MRLKNGADRGQYLIASSTTRFSSSSGPLWTTAEILGYGEKGISGPGNADPCTGHGWGEGRQQVALLYKNGPCKQVASCSPRYVKLK